MNCFVFVHFYEGYQFKKETTSDETKMKRKNKKSKKLEGALGSKKIRRNKDKLALMKKTKVF